MSALGSNFAAPMVRNLPSRYSVNPPYRGGCNRPQVPELGYIRAMVEEAFLLDRGALQSATKKREIAMARHIAMYLCRKFTKASFPAIGRAFGRRHHTTVMYAVATVERTIQNSEIIRRWVLVLSVRVHKGAI